jgi:hypothetical protein
MQRLVSLTYHLDAATDAVCAASPFGAEQLATARILADLSPTGCAPWPNAPS